MTSGFQLNTHPGTTPASSILQARKLRSWELRKCVLGHISSESDSGPGPPPPTLTCPKDDRPWLWASSSPLSTSQLSALGEESGQWGAEWPSPHWGHTRRGGCRSCLGLRGVTHQGVLQLCVRVRYRMPRW